MKILYSLPRTGNGHLARAQEILPRLEKWAEVDVLMSGTQSQLKIPFEVKFSLPGISLIYNKKGGVSYLQTLRQNQIFDSLKTINQLPVKDYDLIVNDFEPISAWAAKIQKVPSISLSHQSAMNSPLTPKPKRKDPMGEFILKKYAPTERAVGFHFHSYDDFIYKPIIRQKIRQLIASKGRHFVVYIPGIGDENLYRTLSQLDVEWHVFSKNTKEIYRKGNLHFFPVNESNFLSSLASCKGVLCNAGFELPSEALFLKKMVFAIPLKRQYEQKCNAIALAKMGIRTSKSLTLKSIQDWIEEEKYVTVDYEKDQLNEILETHIKW